MSFRGTGSQILSQFAGRRCFQKTCGVLKSFSWAPSRILVSSNLLWKPLLVKLHFERLLCACAVRVPLRPDRRSGHFHRSRRNCLLPRVFSCFTFLINDFVPPFGSMSAPKRWNEVVAMQMWQGVEVYSGFCEQESNTMELNHV